MTQLSYLEIVWSFWMLRWRCQVDKRSAQSRSDRALRLGYMNIHVKFFPQITRFPIVTVGTRAAQCELHRPLPVRLWAAASQLPVLLFMCERINTHVKSWGGLPADFWGSLMVHLSPSGTLWTPGSTVSSWSPQTHNLCLHLGSPSCSAPEHFLWAVSSRTLPFIANVQHLGHSSSLCFLSLFSCFRQEGKFGFYNSFLVRNRNLCYLFFNVVIRSPERISLTNHWLLWREMRKINWNVKVSKMLNDPPKPHLPVCIIHF